MRFIRKYELSITTPDNITTIVKPPLRIAFQCSKSAGRGLNNLVINVYNLKESNRLKIVKDREEDKNIKVTLKVGYEGTTLETIFKGNVFFSSNKRSGANYISFMECLDGMFDYTNSITSKTVTDVNTAVTTLLDDMPNTDVGKITELDPLLRPKVLVGNSYTLFDQIKPIGTDFYIDNEQAFILKKEEVISRFLPVVQASTGLLNTPQRENQKITFQTLMNPALKLSSRCDVRSKVAPHINGVYKIEAMVYNGDYEGSEWSQTVTGIAGLNFKVV